MTVGNLLKITTCPIELRSGRRSLFAKINPANVSKHLGEEVVQIFSKGRILVIRSEVPQYELDADVDLSDVGTDDDLPW